jgi:hypothetical protein
MEDEKLKDLLTAARESFAVFRDDFHKEAEAKWNELDNDTKILLTGHVFSKIKEHMKNPGSYRYLIYERLGFKSDAYVPLYFCGGMDISNGCHDICDKKDNVDDDD